jgi:pyrroline-5-carboxylate reductase
MTQQRIGFIGAGNMSRCLIGGLLNTGWPKDRILVSDPDAGQRQAVEKNMGVKVFADNNDVVKGVEILVLAVKPQVLQTAASEIADAVQQRRPLVISIAAGVRSGEILRWLGDGIHLVRAMPNTPALVGSGASGLYAASHVAAEQRDIAESILRTVGVTVWLSEESLLDTVTAVSGSGPAYFFLIIEALEKAAMENGLDSATARLLAVETAFGAAKMALESGEEPAQLRRRVTSPGGTTERAIKIFEQGDIHTLFSRAVRAAVERSRELAQTFARN